MINISKNITYHEGTKSVTAVKNNIDNTPSKDQLADMKVLANKVFEPLRTGLGNKAINIAIFFRSPELNKAVGGAKGSQHMEGKAMDIDNDVYKKGPTNKQIFEYIKNNLEFDQLINEFPDEQGNPSWVHVSYNKGNNRKQILVAKHSTDWKGSIKTIYEIYNG
jgi:hypothetical protein